MLRGGKRGSRPRSDGGDRGGSRKRGGGMDIDREGDIEMDKAMGRDNKRRAGPYSGGSRRPGPHGRQQNGDREQTLDALQRAVFSGPGQANARSGRGRPHSANSRGPGLVEMSVRGWRDSQGALDPDGGVNRLVSWIERKATPRNTSAPPLRISKSRKEGDALIISIRPEYVAWVNRINGYDFLGSKLRIEDLSGGAAAAAAQSVEGPSQAAIDTKAKMTAFLQKRYIPQTKVLDLSRLGNDPDLIAMGMFNSTSTESKFFPALMKVCELSFESVERRKEAVQSVSLAYNELRNVAAVSTLSQTFPELQNLDLSHNSFKDFADIQAWRWKFRDLDFLDLSDTPLSSDPMFKETLMKWYPKLRVLNQVQVRTPEEIAMLKKSPIPVVGPSFQDESQIAENFVKAFFVGFDNDRENIARGIYDAYSSFSLNVNAAAPRALQGETTAGWDNYIRKSRNLSRLNQLPARMSRLCTGVDSIIDAWKSLPKTKHPDILSSPQQWLVECHPMPALPDLSGQSTTGVGGLLVTVHGQFDEVEELSGRVLQTRSFDRVFILAPGGGVGGLRVSNDMLTLRAYGGSEAWIPDGAVPPAPTPSVPTPVPPQAAMPPTAVPPMPVAPTPPVAPQVPVHPQAKDGYGMPAPGKPEEQVQREQAVLQISFQTRMTLEFSEMALTGNGWNMDAALRNFEELKAQGALPPNAFLPGV